MEIITKKNGGELELVCSGRLESSTAASLAEAHNFSLLKSADGVTEATNQNNELFSDEWLLETINRISSEDLPHLLENIKKENDGYRFL